MCPLCPPHPTAEVLGIETGSTAAERDRAAAVIEAFMWACGRPAAVPFTRGAPLVNEVAKLLVYSPGEPMELALGGHGLTDRGYFPG